MLCGGLQIRKFHSMRTFTRTPAIEVAPRTPSSPGSVTPSNLAHVDHSVFRPPTGVDQATRFVTARRLLGLEVWSPAIDLECRSRLGEIRDCTVTGGGGAMDQVLIESGSLTRLNLSLRKVAYSSIRVDFRLHRSAAPRASIDSGLFVAAPRVARRCSKDYGARAASRQLDRTGESPRPHSDPSPEAARCVLPDDRSVLISELEHLPVRASHGSLDEQGAPVDGVPIGWIHDAWIDLHGGSIAYLTLELGGRYVVAPISLMSILVDRGTESLYFEMPCSLLQAEEAPAVDEEGDQTLRYAAFRASIVRFYGQIVDGRRHRQRPLANHR
jgi:hypothetical protein